MNHIEGKAGGFGYRADISQPIDISIPLAFGGPQPNHFGAPPATAEPLEGGGFIGDTRRGGSCNAEAYRLVPHCNGTHTECVGHVTDDRISIRDTANSAFVAARLISVKARTRHGESRITESDLAETLDGWDERRCTGLIVRTLPNARDKCTRVYGAASMPAWFTTHAIHAVVNAGIEHLLVDLPSIDRYHDDGKLAAHRVFWGLPTGSRRASDATREKATITEMIFVPDAVADGDYLLNLQLPPFATDAAPSRPLLFPLEWLE
ncbi:MAG: cyclase family protein [Gammaproteobacteria bacterium]